MSSFHDKSKQEQIARNVETITKEAFSGMRQVFLAVTELDEIQGDGTNIGIHRLREAARYFDWCSQEIAQFATRLEGKQDWRK